MDKTQVYQKLLAHAQASRQAGTPDSETEQALSAFESKNPQIKTMSAATTPTSQISPIGQVGQPTQPNQNDNQVARILKQLKLTPGESIGNAANIAFGGKPIYDPNMGREALKSSALMKMINPTQNYVTSYDAEGKPMFTPAPAGHIVQQPFNATPTGQQLDSAKIQEANQKIEESKNKLNDSELQKQNQTQSIIDAANQNLQSVEAAKKGSKYFGVLGNLPSYAAPSSLVGEYGPRKEWENNINQLLKQKVVDLITKMKSASKTGATGFGQLSDREGQLLQQASTALTKDLPPDIALKYLNQMESLNQKILSGKQQQVTDSNQQTDVNNDPLGVL